MWRKPVVDQSRQNVLNCQRGKVCPAAARQAVQHENFYLERRQSIGPGTASRRHREPIDDRLASPRHFPCKGLRATQDVGRALSLRRQGLPLRERKRRHDRWRQDAKSDDREQRADGIGLHLAELSCPAISAPAGISVVLVANMGPFVSGNFATLLARIKLGPRITLVRPRKSRPVASHRTPIIADFNAGSRIVEERGSGHQSASLNLY